MKTFKLWLINENIDPSVVPQGQYYMIQMVQTKPEFQGIGIGKLLYQLVLQTSPNNILGIASDTKGRMSGSGPVTGIYKKLGGLTNIQASNGITWDFLLKKNMPKLKLINQPIGKNIVIYSIDTPKGKINFTRQDLDTQNVIRAWNNDFSNTAAQISTDTVNWYPNDEKYYLPDDDPHGSQNTQQPAQGNGNLTLIPQETNKPIPIKIDASIGNGIIQTPNSQKFMSQKQFILKKVNGAWTITQSPDAKNITNINGKPLTEPTILNNGDTISLGKSGQVPIKVNFN
jgi:hypothetical protein